MPVRAASELGTELQPLRPSTPTNSGKIAPIASNSPSLQMTAQKTAAAAKPALGWLDQIKNWLSAKFTRFVEKHPKFTLTALKVWYCFCILLGSTSAIKNLNGVCKQLALNLKKEADAKLASLDDDADDEALEEELDQAETLQAAPTPSKDKASRTQPAKTDAIELQPISPKTNVEKGSPTQALAPNTTTVKEQTQATSKAGVELQPMGIKMMADIVVRPPQKETAPSDETFELEEMASEVQSKTPASSLSDEHRKLFAKELNKYLYDMASNFAPGEKDFPIPLKQIANYIRFTSKPLNNYAPDVLMSALQKELGLNLPGATTLKLKFPQAQRDGSYNVEVVLQDYDTEPHSL